MTPYGNLNPPNVWQINKKTIPSNKENEQIKKLPPTTSQNTNIINKHDDY